MNIKDIRAGSQLKELISVDPSIEILGITDNSKKVTRGSLFVAVKGHEQDGHHYIQDAVKNGAVLIVGQEDLHIQEIPYIKVENSRQALGQLATAFYQNPSQHKIVIGITGTNGKTTTSFFLKHLLEKSGYSVSLIGTIYTEINGVRTKSLNTTPNAGVVHEMLAHSTDQVVVIEVSSHGLMQYRMEGIEFDYALFNNLQHDHLDYHHTMEEYFETKSLLFQKLKPDGMAVINGNDLWGRKLAANLLAEGKQPFVIGYEKQNDLEILTLSNHKAKLKSDTEQFILDSVMPGTYNLYNLIMASSVIHDLGMSYTDVNAAMQDFDGVPGRFEQYLLRDGVKFVIDYAHTAEAIELCLQTARSNGAQRITHIFGFRGGRDKTKRKKMLQASCRFSDRSILTIDDLNGVSNERMLEKYQDMQRVCNVLEHSSIIMDRTKAIQEAIGKAEAGDWIIITGKGHEDYKEAFEFPARNDKETVLYFQGSNMQDKN